MAQRTKCQTPGALYYTRISGKTLTVQVELPKELALSEEDATLLESNLHNAVELVLARYFVAQS